MAMNSKLIAIEWPFSLMVCWGAPGDHQTQNATWATIVRKKQISYGKSQETHRRITGNSYDIIGNHRFIFVFFAFFGELLINYWHKLMN